MGNSSSSITLPLPRKKRSILWWLAGAFLLLLGLFLFQLLGPDPPIIISKQTTYITAPLLPSGQPIYEEYMRQKMRKGVTPENNAALLLYQALWPSGLDPEHYAAVAAELGLKEIPSAEAAMQSVYGDANRKRVLAWLPKPGPDDVEPDADSLIDPALKHPWTSQQLPPLAEWVNANLRPLDLIVEASHRPRYYSPSPTLLDDRHDMLIEMLLPGPQTLRDAARGLSVRAMLHIGENRFSEAWQDIFAMYRLSALVAQGPTLVELLVGMAIRSMACQSTAVLLSSDQLPKELVRQIKQDLAGVRPFANVAHCIDQSERVSTLDAVVHSSMYGFDVLDGSGAPSKDASPVDFASVDWNVILQKLNLAFDQAAAAMKLPEGAQRRQAFDRYNDKLIAESSLPKQPGRLIASLVSRRTRSDLIGSIYAALLLPAMDAASSAEDRTNSILTLTQLAAALAVYRAEHGDYPEKLEELVPTVLSELPVDTYNAKPFIYKCLDKGYLLYTTGLNGRDDAGSSEQLNILEGRSTDDLDPSERESLLEKIPADSDDFSIRLPVPSYELPKSPSP